MLILDSLLIGGIKFVLDKVASAVDEEMNDETSRSCSRMSAT
jgi:hypothetical protein